MLGKLMFSDAVKASYDPITQFPKLKPSMSLSLCYPRAYFEAGTQDFYTSITVYLVIISL